MISAEVKKVVIFKLRRKFLGNFIKLTFTYFLVELIEAIYGRRIRISEERLIHISENHPEMKSPLFWIEKTLSVPDEIWESKTDARVELYYRRFIDTQVGDKYLCVVLKIKDNNNFMLTAYFTDTIKKGRQLWKRK